MIHLNNGKYIMDNGISFPTKKFFTLIEVNRKFDYSLSVTDENQQTITLRFDTLEDATYFVMTVVKDADDFADIFIKYNSTYLRKRNNKYIIDQMQQIEKARKDIRKRLDELWHRESELRRRCRHDIVFMYRTDDYDTKYYCPCCGMTSKFMTPFNGDVDNHNLPRVFDLTDSFYTVETEVQSIIHDEVINHYTEYYRSVKDHSELLERIKKLLNSKLDNQGFAKQKK